MSEPIPMKSRQFVTGDIGQFNDDQGNPQAVDGFHWAVSGSSLLSIDDPASMHLVMHSGVMSDDAPGEMGVLELHVDEGGVTDAFVMKWDVPISSRTSPLATGASVTFGAAQDEPTP